MKLSLLNCAPLLVALVVQADTTVTAPSPGGPGTDSNNYDPFLIQQLGYSSMRYQQVYGASEFAGLDPGGEQITSLTFYMDNSLPTNRFYGWTLNNIQINLSTTAGAADSLSPVFSLNVGTNDLVVYGPGQLSFLALGGGATLQIPLSKPFLYNPAMGNLLLDVRVLVAGGMPDFNNPLLDAQLTPLDSVSRVFINDVNALSGTIDTLGLRTRFTTKSVPEPSAFSIFVVGLGTLLASARRWLTSV